MPPSTAPSSRPDIARKRQRWKLHQGKVDPRRLVFIDETWIKTNMTPECNDQRLLFGCEHSGADRLGTHASIRGAHPLAPLLHRCWADPRAGARAPLHSLHSAVSLDGPRRRAGASV